MAALSRGHKTELVSKQAFKKNNYSLLFSVDPASFGATEHFPKHKRDIDKITHRNRRQIKIGKLIELFFRIDYRPIFNILFKLVLTISDPFTIMSQILV